MRRIAAVTVSTLLVLGLTSCFGNPIKNIVEEVVEERTGIEVSTGEGDRAVSLPDGWPGLPLPEGTITSALKADTTFALTMAVDSEDEIERVVAELLAQGFEETARVDYGGLKSVVLTSPEWSVSLGWLPDDSGAFVLNYGVADKS